MILAHAEAAKSISNAAADKVMRMKMCASHPYSGLEVHTYDSALHKGNLRTFTSALVFELNKQQYKKQRMEVK